MLIPDTQVVQPPGTLRTATTTRIVSDCTAYVFSLCRTGSGRYNRRTPLQLDDYEALVDRNLSSHYTSKQKLHHLRHIGRVYVDFLCVLVDWML